MNENIGNLNLWFYIAIFPGYLVYHALLTLGFFDFYFGYFSILLFCFLIINFGFCVVQFFFVKSQPFVYFGVLVFVVGLFWAGLVFVFERYVYGGVLEEAVDYFLIYVVWATSLFFIGLRIPVDLSVVIKPASMFFLICFGLVFYYYEPEFGVFYLGEARGIGLDVGGLSNYQGAARSLSLVSILLLSILPKYGFGVYKFVVLISAVAAVFITGSRLDFAGMVLVSMAFWLIAFSPDWKIASLPVFFVVLGVGAVYFSDHLIHRFGDLLTGNDASALARDRLSQLGLDDIGSDPILGKFMGQLTYGSVGSYMHNLFSSWRQFGVFGFVLYSFILVAPLVFALYVISCKRPLLEVSKFRIMIYLVLFTTPQAIVGRSVYWALPMLTFGVFIHCLHFSSKAETLKRP